MAARIGQRRKHRCLRRVTALNRLFRVFRAQPRPRWPGQVRAGDSHDANFGRPEKRKGGHDADTLNTNRQGEPDRSYENRARALNGPRGSSPSRHSPAVATSAKGRPAAIRESGPGGRHSSSTSAKGAVENQARPGRSEQVVQLVCSSSGPPYLGSTQSARASGEPLSRSPIIVASAPSGWLRCCETMVALRGPRANGQGCAERSGFHDAKLASRLRRPFRLLRPYGIWAWWEHDPVGTECVIPGHGEVT